MNTKISFALLPVFLAFSLNASSQVRVSDSEYKAPSVLPVAAAVAPVVSSLPVKAVTVSAGLPVAEALPPAPNVVAYEVLPSDRTIREVLQRWAKASGWVHDQSHWTLNRDFPVEGTASADFFKGDFKEAVRILLSSTQGGDLPAQPCFYTNHIVRVVPLAELCDRNVAVSQ